MEATHYKEIEEHVPQINEYVREVEWIEEFFGEKELDIRQTTPIFGNHIITLLERVDQNEQNSMETNDVDKMSAEAETLTDEFACYIDERRSFEITDFEKFLLTIYFEQLIKGEN